VDDIIKQAYNSVNTIIYDKSTKDKECEGMGTTLTTAILYKDNLYVDMRTVTDEESDIIAQAIAGIYLDTL